MLGHERLDKQRAAFRIDARPDPIGHVVEGVLDDLAGIGVVARQRVPVGDEVEAVVLLLQLDPVLQRANQVAQVQPSGGTHPGDDAARH